MNTDKKHVLEQIPANRKLVDVLYSQQKISREERDKALDFLYPTSQWQQWISLLFLTFGTVLILTGIVYFFAFNWAVISPTIKFASIQIGVGVCLIGAYFYSLQRLSGQLLLLAGSVLIGVLLAVFGQVYQTGADNYQLFMMWAILIFAWTLLSNFAAQWAVWLVIVNTALSLWWAQAASPKSNMEAMILTYLGLLNMGFLLLREYLVNKHKVTWLIANWSRLILVLVVLMIGLISVFVFVFEIRYKTLSINLAFAFALISHGLLFFIYRYKLPDIQALALTVLSCCLIFEIVLTRLLFSSSMRSEGTSLFLMAIFTLGLFTSAVVYLKNTMVKMEAAHV